MLNAAGVNPEAVHPRVCGERRNVEQLFSDASRFIPACAGNAHGDRPSPSQPSVHPRVCGERINPHRSPPRGGGSSPRVRGTQGAHKTAFWVKRFIPACAGNAHEHVDLDQHSAVHPRVCGERWTARCSTSTGDGSSPRVRGTRIQRDAAMIAERFIPACAGNACASRSCAFRWTVHPRVCGERAC